ncbi:MAG TPA: D-alanyl-D-alanine carboxypeptidase [Terrimesophilobacter sp.]|nr:D-alanyl-D-alanine carboxypeptidase [Terrimesophilobacter sp.]
MTDQQPLSRRAARNANAKPAKAPRAAKKGKSGADPTVTDGSVTDGSVTDDSGKPRSLTPKQRTTLLATALGVVFVMLSAGAVYAGVQVGSQTTAPKPPIDLPIEDRLVPLDIAQPAILRTCSVSELAENARLGVFSGTVINIDTGEVLFDRDGDAGATPADLVKVLTGVAAIASLGPDFQFTTRVYAGTEPGSIVLVGGGDPTLSRLPGGQESLYRGAPKLATLASATQSAWDTLNPPTEVPAPSPSPTPSPTPSEDPEDPEGPEPSASPTPTQTPPPAPTFVKQPITKIFYDTTAWSSADTWNTDWESSALTSGTVPRIVPLMIDGDRADPSSFTSARSSDPAAPKPSPARWASAVRQWFRVQCHRVQRCLPK